MESEMIAITSICSLSIVMCLVCIILYLKEKKIALKNLLSCKIITQMLEITFSIVTIINHPPSDTDPRCFIQANAFILLYTLLMQWNLIILLKLYFELKAKKFKFWIPKIISLVISIACCIAANFLEYSKKSTYYCSFHRKSDYTKEIFYTTLTIFILWTIIILVLLYKIYKISRSRVNENQGLCKYLLNIMPSPILFAFCNSVYIIRTIIMNSQHKIDSSDSLFAPSVCLSRSHGFINGTYILWLYKKHKKEMKSNSVSIDSYLINTRVLGC